jgi:hypothetical protein
MDGEVSSSDLVWKMILVGDSVLFSTGSVYGWTGQVANRITPDSASLQLFEFQSPRDTGKGVPANAMKPCGGSGVRRNLFLIAAVD